MKAEGGVNAGRRIFRRHQDPISALLAYQLLVTLVPYSYKAMDRLSAVGQLQVSLSPTLSASWSTLERKR